jgi:cytochrome c551/c552
MRRVQILAAGLLLLVLLAGCNQSAAAEAGGDPEAGEALFMSGGESQIPCISCHSLDGSILVGPSLQGISERAAERMDGVEAEDYLHQSIISPSAYIVDGYSDAMYKFYGEKLTEKQITDLIAFLLTQ